MGDVKIQVMRAANYADLMEKYENTPADPCNIRVGDVFISRRGEKPEGMCDSAWETMLPFVRELARGGGNFFDGWMKNSRSAMISCNDGFRPVSFYISAIDENPCD